MEVVLAALITSFGGVIIALLTRSATAARKGREKAEEAVSRAEALQTHVATNGSKMTLGELAEAIFTETRATKNAVRRLDAKVERHLAAPVEVGHPTAEEE